MNHNLKFLSVLSAIVIAQSARPILAVEAPTAGHSSQASHSGQGNQPASAPPSKVKIDDDILKQIFALTEKPETPEAIDKMLKTEEEGVKFKNANDIDKALAKFQEAYGLAKEIKNGEGEGRALTHMSQIYFEKGQLVRAKELGENATEVLHAAQDKKSLGRANITLAQVYYALDNTMGAIDQLDSALKCYNDLTAKDSAETARIMVLAGNLASSIGNVKQATLFLKGAAAAYGQANDFPNQLNIELAVIKVLLDCGLYTAAIEEADQSLHAANNSQKPELIAAATSTLASCQYAMGEYAKALKTYEEALNVKVPGQNATSRAIIDEGHLFALAAIGEIDQAKAIAEKILPVIKAQSSALDNTCVLNVLGVIECQKGHFEKAIPLFKEASETQGLVKPRRDRLAVIIMQNLAAAESHVGENRSAKEHLTAAINLLSTQKFRDPVLMGQTYSSFAEICLNLKDIPQAQEYLTKGIGISTKVNDDASLWRDYTSLARVQMAQGLDPHESLVSAVSFFRSPQAGNFPAPDRFTYPTTREEMAHELTFLLIDNGMVEEALLVTEQLKEDFFIAEWLRRGGEVKPGDRELYYDLASQRIHLHTAEVTATPNMLTKEWQSWLGRFGQLANENPSLACLIAPVPISITEMVKMAQQNHTTVIDYLVGAHSTAVFAIDSRGMLYGTRVNIGKQELQAQVSAVIAQSKNRESAEQNERRILQLLYNELIPEKYQAILPKNPDQTIVIVPDSILFNLPFAALVGPNGKYLVEDHTLTIATSLRGLANSPAGYSSEMSVLVTAGNGPSESQANHETTMISNVFEPDQIIKLIGKDGEIGALEEQAKNKVVLHIAENIPLADSNPLRSKTSFSSNSESNTPVTVSNLFGLALPTSLAVCSGTSINAKDSQGKGVNLFSRGLNYAGIRNVLMSLWLGPEPERSDELLEFYRGRQQGLNQAQSLRKAQLLALSKDHSVHNWAAFQLIGPGN